MNEERKEPENATDEYAQIELVPDDTNTQFERDMEIDSARLGMGDPPCRRCGCTDADGCDGGCHWVEPDLCSQCAGRIRGPAYRRSLRGRKVA